MLPNIYIANVVNMQYHHQCSLDGYHILLNGPKVIEFVNQAVLQIAAEM